MRDYVLLYINGRRYEIRGTEILQSLSDFLRYELSMTGTKIVCEEGDCGACTVLLGVETKGRMRYRMMNSCIQFLYQLDRAHIITIEGLKYDGELNPVQKAMMDHHGAQCGFCTPGFIVAMCDLAENKLRNSHGDGLSRKDLKVGLTGNLCRCTGYEPILRAGGSVRGDGMRALDELYPPEAMLSDFKKHALIPIEAKAMRDDREIAYANPLTWRDAASFKKKHEDCMVIAGGTDLGVRINKLKRDPEKVLSLTNIAEATTLEYIYEEDGDGPGEIAAGALVNWTELEQTARGVIPEFAAILSVFASPQIKNVGTLAGNIINASPIADSLPFLFVTDARIEFTSPEGVREVPINELYRGYKDLDMRPDEILSRVMIPVPPGDDILKLYKVSKRRDLDISTFTAAALIRRENGIIESARLAYGGVGPVVLRLPRTEKFLTGKPFSEEVFHGAGEIARTEITPISDVRGGAEFRLQLAENILLRLYHESAEAPAI